MLTILRNLIDNSRGQRGQMAVMGVGVLIMSLGVIVISVDVGWWLRDKRDAQNDADAVALAAVQEIGNPALRPLAVAAGLDWADFNGLDSGELGTPDCLDGEFFDSNVNFCFIDQNSDGTDDMVRVKVSRPSNSFLADAMGVGSPTLNPSAAAATVYVSGACVMPWGIVGEDGHREHLFHLDEETLYVFQNQDEFVEGSPGNAGAISIYGQGADTYGEAIEGNCDPENNSCTNGESIVFVDETLIGCRSKPGQMGNVTDTHLDNRFGGTAPSPGACDAATFDAALILVEDPNCAQRLVPVAVINDFPPSGSKIDLDIYGIVNFYLAGWSQDNSCFIFPDGSERCGFVWGYLITNAPVSTAEVVFTRDFIPFAPTGGALVE
jgi:hypothetical protein